MSNVCSHGQLARQCPICEKNADIKAAYMEGYRDGFSAHQFKKGYAPEAEYETSNAKVDASV